ncbi:MAG: hypothetical protein ACREP9_06880 [Candidatus Dormibacteraceae bacterium]
MSGRGIGGHKEKDLLASLGRIRHQEPDSVIDGLAINNGHGAPCIANHQYSIPGKPSRGSDQWVHQPRTEDEAWSHEGQLKAFVRVFGQEQVGGHFERAVTTLP